MKRRPPFVLVQDNIWNYTVECHRNPTWARGMVAALDDQLAQRIRGGST